VDTALELRVRTSGVIGVVWHGDPARGCAASAMCDVEGSITFRPASEIQLEIGSDGSSGFGIPEPDVAVVRVRRTTPGLPAQGCTDVVPMDFETHLADVTDGQLTFGFAGLGLSSGRCAGPRPNDLVAALPRSAMPARDVARVARDIDLSGRSAFVAGPFSGTVISDVKIHVDRARRVRSDSSSTIFENFFEIESGLPRRVVGLALTYRTQPLGGSIVSEFAGLHSPACQVFDACGARGRSSLELKSRAGEVFLFGLARRGKRRPSLASLLRRARRNRLPLFGFANFPNMTARVSEQVTFPDGRSCADSVFADVPDAAVRRGRGRLAIVLTSAGDTVRTHCPGPSEDDATHTDVLARASFDLREVGRPSLPLGLGTPRTFSARGFSGTRRGTLPLELKLLDAQVITGRGF
jgi:hypothetical protein